MKKGFYTLLFLYCCLFKAYGQDGHFSLYDDAPIFLNPAMTGVIKGDWRVHGQYRTQWKAVNYKPYTTALVSFDMSHNKWGFGVQVKNFRAGSGNYNDLQALLSAAYTTPIDKKKYHNISIGVSGGMHQKSLEDQLLTFDNQYTVFGGGGFDQNINSNENLSRRSQILPSVNAGIMYFFSKQQSRLNPFVGVSAFNLTQPKETFYADINKLPMRFYAHVGTRINITELLYLTPKVLIMGQKKFSEQTYAIDAGYYFAGGDFYLTGGALFRVKDASVIYLGVRMENITAKVAYDINVSSLTRVSGGRGGFELSLTYIHKKSKPSNDKICPRL